MVEKHARVWVSVFLVLVAVGYLWLHFISSLAIPGCFSAFFISGSFESRAYHINKMVNSIDLGVSCLCSFGFSPLEEVAAKLANFFRISLAIS